ncbi:hypothetical protein WJX77_011060 [Trebouxia sp. C0004]
MQKHLPLFLRDNSRSTVPPLNIREASNNPRLHLAASRQQTSDNSSTSNVHIPLGTFA